MTAKKINRAEQMPAADEMVIAICADKNFATPLCVALASVAMNLLPEEKAIIYVLDGGLAPKHRNRLVRCIAAITNRIRLVLIDSDLKALGPLKGVAYLGTGTYLRLLIPELLPISLAKLIFLDSDLIVLSSLGAMWKTEVGSRPLLAVQDLSVPTFGSPAGLLETYKLKGMPSDLAYFNAGVGIWNLDLWRSESISPRITRFLQDNQDRLRWADQDGINVTLAGQIGPLDSRWNYMYGSMAYLPKADRERLLAEACIIHYTGPAKPWRPGMLDPERREFLKYLRRSGWMPPLEYAVFITKYMAVHLRRTVRYKYLGPIARWLLRRK